MKILKIFLIGIIGITLCSCQTNITINTEDANAIKEYVIYSNEFIEKISKENPNIPQRQFEPFRARFRSIKPIILKF